MGVDSERFRRRARECRDLSIRARDPDIRLFLIQVAQDLEGEAARIDLDEKEEAARDKQGDAEPL